jgi:hypothetical protein
LNISSFVKASTEDAVRLPLSIKFFGGMGVDGNGDELAGH